MSRRWSSRVLLALLLVAGCKSSDAADAGATDAADDGPGVCGDASCGSGQLCVSRQGCATLTCTAVPASGVCPAGSSATSSCPDGGAPGPGCIASCPVTYACVARPAGCATLSCTCAASLCAPATCVTTMNDHVACAAQ